MPTRTGERHVETQCHLVADAHGCYPRGRQKLRAEHALAPTQVGLLHERDEVAFPGVVGARTSSSRLCPVIVCAPGSDAAELRDNVRVVARKTNSRRAGGWSNLLPAQVGAAWLPLRKACTGRNEAPRYKCGLLP